MAVQTFNFPVLTDGAGTKEYITRTAAFGDSYAQVSGEGINSSKKSWSVSYVGTKSKVDEVIAFLDARKGYESFIWTDPNAVTSLYRCKSWQIVPSTSNVFTLTTTFEEAFSS